MNINKALVVDDSKVAHVLLSKLLKERGIEVDWVGSGKEAIDYLKRQRSDIVFMDVMMPGMDGFETTDTINKDTSVYAPPIIMCSANATDEDQEIARTSGAKGFLSKPYTPDELDQVLNMVSELPQPEEPVMTSEDELLDNVTDQLDLSTFDTDISPPEPSPEPIAIDTGASQSNDALTSREVTDIARKVAAQAVQAQAEEIASRKANDIARQAIQEAEQAIAEKASKAAQESAQATAVETARTLIKQALKVLSEKIPNADAIRRDISKKLEPEVAKNLQRALAGDEFKQMIHQLVKDQIPAVETAARQAATEAAQVAAREAAEEIALPAAEEALKEGLKNANNRALIGIGLGAIALLLAIAGVLGVL